tara:strand:+ start:1763 stop:1969 length:207 start_codon:yes stop_codon:yes gene_type:complete
MNTYNDWSKAPDDLALAFIGDWSIAMPTADCSVPNWTAHHPDGTILCATNTARLECKIAEHEMQWGTV